MPDLEAKLVGFVSGDSIEVRRIVDRVVSGFASGITIVEAWMTFKVGIADADPGLLQKIITTSDVPGEGHIENDGTGDVNPVLRFDLTNTDTLAVGHVVRDYDIKIRSSSGGFFRLELGSSLFKQQVTVDT